MSFHVPACLQLRSRPPCGSSSSLLENEIANFDIRYDGWRSATGFNWQRTFGVTGRGLLGITRRSNSQQFGEPPGIFPVLGLDWRF